MAHRIRKFIVPALRACVLSGRQKKKKNLLLRISRSRRLIATNYSGRLRGRYAGPVGGERFRGPRRSRWARSWDSERTLVCGYTVSQIAVLVTEMIVLHSWRIRQKFENIKTRRRTKRPRY